METISGTFYRVDGEFSVRGLTVVDVLNFEAHELGNEDALNALENLDNNQKGILGLAPASRLLWCCKNKVDALRYARDEDGNDVEDESLVDEYVTSYNVRDALVIIPEDGDGGMLLLLNS